MPMLLVDHYHTAKQSLERSGARTILTISGVAIGIASITAILALSAGVTNIVKKQLVGAGDTIALVRPTAKAASLSDLSNPTPQTAYSTSPITEKDYESIIGLKDTQYVAPLMTISANIREKDGKPVESTLLATTPDLEFTNSIELQNNQFLDSVTSENTAVIGSQLAIDLFGTEQSVGKTFLVREQRFTVIDVLKQQEMPINYSNVDFDRAAIISFESGKLFNSGVSQIQQINIKAKAGTNMSDFVDKINSILLKNHDGNQSSTAITGEEISKPTSNLFKVVTAVTSLVAGISLVVGGIGIMNVMLVGVSERTREIGLRKAVGASNGTIILQFMIESLIISLLGGLAGFALGYIAAFVLSMYIPYDPAFSWSIVAWAAGLAFGVGIIFGLYPAIRAARKDPIESLRRYH